jgi:chromosome segregation protein
MYLEKLEIQGFKSFANKNSLEFPGMIDKERRGITCIVGPNGSGKSNIADAVRWVLGEQSMKQLRGKKSEDVIFSGSDKKSKLGMSEVSLFLNNEDKKAPLDYSQIVLTRRLYRDGASDYLLNNSRVRLSDMQILLAKAKFGQRTYSVIGQGMVEGFLNTSLAERKEFFDEATGVREFQIKRDESLNKLKLSYENLSQAGMLLTEIEPRLKSLTRQVNKLQKREELEAELKEIQLSYYAKNWHEINDKFNARNKEYLEIEKEKIEKEKKLAAFNSKLSQMEANNESGLEFNKWQKELADLQTQKDRLTVALAKLDARLEVRLEAEGKFDLSWLNNKKGEIEKDLEKINSELGELEREEKIEKNKLEELLEEKGKISKKISELNAGIFKKDSFSDNEKIKKINLKISELLTVLAEVGKNADIDEIKKAVEKIKSELKNILDMARSEKAGAGAEMEETQKELMKLTGEQEKILSLIGKKNNYFSAKTERIKIFKEKIEELKRELENIENKLKQNQNKISAGEIGGEKEKIKSELEKQEVRIKEVKEKISGFSAEEEKKRALLFEAQKNIQSLQNEINNLNNRLNEIKINSTRYETKLEDLEAEIRHAFGDLKKIKETKVDGEVDNEAALNKIENLKRQLDMIGGIDPEVEKEYVETKERFDFLSGQTKDLSEAINSLEKIIKELDLVIKERFDKEFKIISQKFEEYFKILFNGGNAKIMKVLAQEGMEDKDGEKGAEGKDGQEEKIDKNPSASSGQAGDIDIKRIKFLQKHNATGLAGVEIQATPPGKKIKSISMLSGGERALTAIALICAIISANPSPFVVLDEVDAALDEANSERLAKILDDLSHRTQFIIITHNRASMRRANILYGVTMQDDGVSKLLSIKLDEAEKRVR